LGFAGFNFSGTSNPWGMLKEVSLSDTPKYLVEGVCYTLLIAGTFSTFPSRIATMNQWRIVACHHHVLVVFPSISPEV
jgi:hypothetical protein